MYDYIVIGSGFGGSVTALRLVKKGYSVLVIEKGERYSHLDFPKTNWNMRKYLWVPALRFFGFQKLTFNRNASILSGVGGGSLVYASTLFHPPMNFFRHPSWKDFADWEKVLNPFYEKAGFMMGRNQGNKKVPVYIDIGQKVMESYAQKSGGIAQNVILEVLFNRPTTAKASIRLPLKNNWKKYHDSF